MAELKQIVRLCDTDLNGKLTIERSIMKIKGIGHAFSRAVRIKSGYDNKKLLGNLTDEEMKKLEEIIKKPSSTGIKKFMFNRQKDYDTGIDTHLTSTELDLEQKSDVARLKGIKTYKGVRHAVGLKVRGQRTKSTGRKSSAVGVSKKKVQPAKGAAKGGTK
jgi:small subunit ribosomal protein S13